MGIYLEAMKCVVVVLACALCLCSGYDLNTDADGSLGLPPSGDDVQPMDSDLKADKSFMAAQESLKQAQALPDVQTDDLGLGEAKQAAEAQAFTMKAGQEANADSMLLGESYKEQHQNEKKGHIDALMGKLIMSDMFSEKETNEIKSALMRAGSDLGEGKAIPAHKDQVALAKGLSIALASKQQAQDQVKKMSQEMVQSKSKQASQMLATATSLAQCKKGFSEARSATKKTIAKLSAVANHQKTVAGVSMRGLELCNKRVASAEHQVASLKGAANTAVVKSATKAKLTSTSASVSPCCQACSKLSHSQAKLLNADCSGCPAEVNTKMKAPRAPFVAKAGGAKSECCQACSMLSKTDIGLLSADCTGC